MNGRQLAALFKEHGGIKAIHTRPAVVDRRTGRRGWALPCPCGAFSCFCHLNRD